jgi:predicted ester cyclase
MKNLILENDCMQDIPKTLQRILETKFTENREYWVQFSSSYWPENRDKTFERFKTLEEGDNVVCATVFDGWQQLEIMALILASCPKRINFYILVYDLQGQIEEYLSVSESDITPNTAKYNDSWELRRKFKEDMNNLVKLILKIHNIYQLSRYEDEVKKIIISK